MTIITKWLAVAGDEEMKIELSGFLLEMPIEVYVNKLMMMKSDIYISL